MSTANSAKRRCGTLKKMGQLRRQQTFTVLDLPVKERPRERLQELGARSLSAQELLALVLGRGASGESVMTTAQRLLAEFGSLEKVLGASLSQLQQLKGLGVAKASQLMACLEIARRIVDAGQIRASEHSRGERAASPAQMHQLLKGAIRNYQQEHFVVASFDSRDRLLGIDTVAVGTVTASLVHPRETFAVAIDRRADHIAVAHNHPSGDPEPSRADLTVTRRLVEAGKIVGIELSDHLIISRADWFSFRQAGLLDVS